MRDNFSHMAADHIASEAQQSVTAKTVKCTNRDEVIEALQKGKLFYVVAPYILMANLFFKDGKLKSAK
jgi:hypothetical protein